MLFFSSRRRHTRSLCDWSSDVCSSDLPAGHQQRGRQGGGHGGGHQGILGFVAEMAGLCAGRQGVRGRAGGRLQRGGCSLWGEIGRGACRERGEISVGAVSLKKKKRKR